MQTIDLTLAALHVNQQHIVDHAKRFSVIDCGRRFGKSVLAVDLAGQTALDGAPVGYFAPTYKMLADVWRKAKQELAPVIQTKNETEKQLTLITGGWIDFWSLDSGDTARGRKYKRIVGDEWALIKDPDIWPAVIRPMLADYRGDAFFFSTPKGHNHFWQLYTKGLDPNDPEWASFRFKTVDNPFIDPDEIESARLLLPDRLFRQEYLAEFIDDAGGVFRGVTDVSTAAPADPVDGHEYVVGLDWARDVDYTAVSVIDRTAKTEVHIERFNQVSWALQRQFIRTVYERYHPSVIWAESNSIGGPNIEALQADGLPVQPFATTADSKGPLIENVALAVERKQVTLVNDPVATAEMQAYELERLPSGRFRYGAPNGMHDDTVIARALAWHGCSYSATGGIY